MFAFKTTLLGAMLLVAILADNKQPPSVTPIKPLQGIPDLPEPVPLKVVPPRSRSIAAWVKDIESTDRQELFAAVTALESLGAEAKPAVPELIKIIERDKSPARLAAIEILGTIGPDSAPAVPVLTKVLVHKDFHTQYFSLRTLAKIGAESKSALPEMVNQLRTGLPTVRKNAATALGDLGAEVVHDDAISALHEALGDKLFPVREQASLALGKIGKRAEIALPELKELATNRTKSTCTAAAYAIWQITGDVDFSLPILLDEMHRTQNPMEAMRTIGSMGAAAKDAIKPLIEMLKNEEAELRMFAVDALGDIGPAAASAKEAIRPLLQDEEPDVRESAEKALKAIGDSR